MGKNEPKQDLSGLGAAALLGQLGVVDPLLAEMDLGILAVTQAGAQSLVLALHDRDAQAVETWQRLFPDREVVQVYIGNIALGGGGVHCITQQQPAIL